MGDDLALAIFYHGTMGSEFGWVLWSPIVNVNGDAEALIDPSHFYIHHSQFFFPSSILTQVLAAASTREAYSRRFTDRNCAKKLRSMLFEVL